MLKDLWFNMFVILPMREEVCKLFKRLLAPAISFLRDHIAKAFAYSFLHVKWKVKRKSIEDLSFACWAKSLTHKKDVL